jgi:hypothetical protein
MYLYIHIFNKRLFACNLLDWLEGAESKTFLGSDNWQLGISVM